MAMAGFLRKLIPSKTTIFIFIGTYGYLYLRRRYPSSVLAVATGSLVNVALYSFIYLVAGYAVANILISFVIIPLLSALVDDAGEESQEPVGQPTDEESLVPERGPEEPSRDLRGVLSLLAAIFIFPGLAIRAASVLRPSGTGFLLGTWRVLMPVLQHTGMVAGALFFPPLLVSAPLIIIWAIVKRITVEPHKSSWSHVTALSTRITVGTFLYLLAIEGVSLYQPAHLETVVPHLAWQATLLSELFKWLGLGAYACASLWYFTDKAAEYLFNRAAIYLSLQLDPPVPKPLYKGLQKIAQFILFPIAMICHGYMRSPSKGIVSAAIFIAGSPLAHDNTAASDAPADQSSVLDIMAVALIGYTVRDKTGKTFWEQVHEKGEDATDVAAPSETSDLKAVKSEMLGAEKNGSESSEKGEALV
ncbi:hypothetical protein DFH09DRAFT_1178558 [Mycena vulgaris]|nr:hypothetical protein DFH09DRAFT_1178558 [Mycena vulgaris]